MSSQSRKIRRQAGRGVTAEKYRELQRTYWKSQADYKNMQKVLVNLRHELEAVRTNRDALEAFANLFAEALAVAVYTSPELEIKASPAVRKAASEYFVIDEGTDGHLHLMLKRKDADEASND